MEKTKLTKTNKLNALITILDNADIEAVVITVGDEDIEVTKEDLVEYCEKEIEALAKKAAKAKETAAKKKTEDPLLAIVEAALTAEYAPIADISAKVVETDTEATPSKVTYRLTVLCREGKAEKAEISVPTGEGKARKVQGYRKTL